MPSNLKSVRLLGVMAALVVLCLPVAWGQGLPAAGTYNITGAQVGVEADGSMWQTILWFVDVSAGTQDAAVVALLNPDGTPADVTCTLADGTFSTYCVWAGNSVLTDSDERMVLTGLSPTSAASPITIQLLSAGGFAITAVVQHIDAYGNLLSSTALTDPGLLVPAVSASYAGAIDEEQFVDESIILSNPSANASISVTLNAYDGQSGAGARPPIGTKQFVILPLGRVSGLLTEIFPGVNFLSYLNSVGTKGLLQGFFSATASQNFGIAVLRQDIAPNGAIVTTPWSAFPAATPPAGPVAYLSVDSPTSCQGDYTGTITASASVPWIVYVHIGAAKYEPMTSGPIVDANGSVTSATVSWLAPGEFFTLEAQSGGIRQTVTLTPPPQCNGQ